MYYLNTLNFQPTPDFLSVKKGDYVVIKVDNDNKNSSLSKQSQNYRVGQVINCIGGARDPRAWTLFQIMDIDNGETMIINADIVEKILKTSH